MKLCVRLLLVCVLGLASAPAAQAGCLDSMDAELRVLERQLGISLGKLRDRSHSAADLIREMMDWYLTDEEMRTLRVDGLDCPRARAGLAGALQAVADPLLTGNGREVMTFRSGYFFFQTMACRAEELRVEAASAGRLVGVSPEIPGPAPEVVLGRLGILARAGEFLSTPVEGAETGPAWALYVPARGEVVLRLAQVLPLIERITAACSCEAAPRTTLPLPPGPMEMMESVHADISSFLDVPEDPEEAAPETPPVLEVPRGRRAEERRREFRLREAVPTPEMMARAQELARLAEERTRQLMEAERAREAIANQPAELRSEEQILNSIQAALDESLARGGNLPPDFDPFMTRMELDAVRRVPPVTRGEWADINQRWNRTLERMREISRTVSDPTERLTTAAHELVEEYFTHYVELQASPLGALLDGGVNCQGPPPGFLAVLNQIPGLVPPGWEVGIQNFSDHVQAVLVPTDPTRTEVWDLLTNRESPHREAHVFRPALVLRGQLVDHGRVVNSPLATDAALLMREADVRREASSERTANETNFTGAAGGQSWATVSREYRFSDGPNPSEARIEPPAVGSPRRVPRLRPEFHGIAPESGSGRGEGERGRASAEPASPDERAVRARSISSPRVREVYRASHGESHTPFVSPAVRARIEREAREISPDGVASLVQEEDRVLVERILEIPDDGTFLGEVARSRLAEDCLTLRRLGHRCRESAPLRRVIDRVDRILRETADHPERAIASVMHEPPEGMAPSGLGGAPLAALIRLLNAANAAPEEITPEFGGEGRTILHSYESSPVARVEPGSPAERLLRSLMNPELVAPLRSAERTATLLARELERVQDGESTTPSVDPGMESTPLGALPGTPSSASSAARAATAPRSHAAPSAEAGASDLFALYTVEALQFRAWTFDVVCRTSLPVEDRRAAFARYLSAAGPPYDENGRTYGPWVTVCGDIVLNSLQADAVMRMASAFSTGAREVHCPAGSPSGLSPEVEYRNLVRALGPREGRLGIRQFVNCFEEGPRVHLDSSAH